eukprot:scaffold3673_cov393-Prasinococcus_capsulatus_cf.AAC.17
MIETSEATATATATATLTLTLTGIEIGTGIGIGTWSARCGVHSSEVAARAHPSREPGQRALIPSCLAFPSRLAVSSVSLRLCPSGPVC